MPRNAEKTECIHGHRFDERNTRITSRGQRDCRACALARDLRLAIDPAYRERKRAQDRKRPLDPAMRERKTAQARETGVDVVPARRADEMQRRPARLRAASRGNGCGPTRGCERVRFSELAKAEGRGRIPYARSCREGAGVPSGERERFDGTRREAADCDPGTSRVRLLDGRRAGRCDASSPSTRSGSSARVGGPPPGPRRRIASPSRAPAARSRSLAEWRS
jgi:hypothetical protein